MITFHQEINVKTVTAKTLNVSSTESKDLAKAYADTINLYKTLGEFTLLQ